MSTQSIGQILRSARVATGISQAAAARRSGLLSPGSLWKIENDRARPHLQTVLRLAEVYGVTVRFGDAVLHPDALPQA